ncbi:hypothetical protein AUC69_10325 [Methyloceanibacter superfactus]|uniref:Uncharacterized protein n=1 Tax=Methyloceanibacter superfactus TaxID=1774969 RepID=A0A1E3VXK5_9HYPH|nr:hypothetical protein AUC69_10325 [Methyloceanibacter superfactus]
MFGTLLRWIRRDEPDSGPEATNGAEAKRGAEDDGGWESLELKGIDADAGLRFTGGSRKRYVALLGKFAEQQGGTVEIIRLALSNGDAAAAERAATRSKAPPRRSGRHSWRSPRPRRRAPSGKGGMRRIR